MFDPVILFFLFGVTVGILPTKVRLPRQIYDFITILLLLSIGLKGGIEIAKQSIASLIPQMVVCLLMGFLLPFIIFPILRYLGRFSLVDSASIAAHYGSVSVGTFAVSISYLLSKGVYFEEHMALFLVLLESPAILAGILLASSRVKKTNWKEVFIEALLDKGVVLMFGGLLIGWLIGPVGVKPIEPLFFDMFKSILALFLFEMGLIASAQLGSLMQHGLFLIFFGVFMPIISSVIGTFVGIILGFSLGGTVIFATLAASSSYIAVPAAMRVSVPEANPTLSLASSLGITFTFNVLIGIPIYYNFVKKVFLLLGR
ncbi:sodium-dependent bicarbonate transport family permease [Candidatus Dependentiae bacterium]|nr:sodium-dependent bicarbonate transport family permease [Candidatus Dependentiae bacterium]